MQLYALINKLFRMQDMEIKELALEWLRRMKCSELTPSLFKGGPGWVQLSMLTELVDESLIT